MSQEKQIPKIIKWLKKLLLILMSIIILALGMIFIINLRVYMSSKDRILTLDKAMELEDVDCIIVLGAGVKSDGTPTHMLEDRILQGIALYQSGVSDKILMSGDHGTIYYDEVNCMKKYSIANGVPSEAIFMDHAGFCTYDSMYRAKNIFSAKKVVIVTQDYHMYRAIYDARQLGLDAYGVISNPRTYQGQTKREFREILARVKDCMMCIIKPSASVMGDPVSLDQSGDVTNDK